MKNGIQKLMFVFYSYIILIHLIYYVKPESCFFTVFTVPFFLLIYIIISFTGLFHERNRKDSIYAFLSLILLFGIYYFFGDTVAINCQR